jgi:hypothetical protein
MHGLFLNVRDETGDSLFGEREPRTMSSSRRIILVAATSCAATLAFVTTVNISCGVVKPACADQCGDFMALQDRVASLEKALEPVAFRAFLATAQSVPSSGDGAVVAFDMVELDTRSAFDATNHQYVIPVAGQYVITATVGYSGMDKGRANGEIWVATRYRGLVPQAAVTTPGNSSGTGSTVLRLDSATAVHLDAGDRVYVKAFHDYGIDRDLLVGLRDTNLQIIRIPDLE